MSDDVLADQISYYQQRAHEYDATSHGDLAAAAVRIDRLVGELAPTGDVLEIACGTGMWTRALAESAGPAGSVTGLDSSPDAVAIARDRVRSARVDFAVADVFTWDTARTYDVIFFAFWLSHVPADRFAEFWAGLARRLSPGGRVLFVDEHRDEQHKETYLPGAEEIVERRLGDGSAFRIVKNFIDPEELEARLQTLGWSAAIRRDGADWVVGEARP